MKWFGWKTAQVAARPALVRSVTGVPVGDWPRSYDAQVREAYIGNPVAQRAVRLVAEGAAGVSIYAGTGHEAAVALVSAAGVIETVAAQMLLHGNAYVQIISDADGIPTELLPLRPERVTVEPDASGWPVGYVYRAGERTTRYPAADGLPAFLDWVRAEVDG
jgi:phage portal protein BeeE